jgi:hypothetical protein
MKKILQILFTLLLSGNIYGQEDSVNIKGNTISLTGKWILIESGKTTKLNMGWNFLENGKFQTIPTGNKEIDKDWTLKEKSFWLLEDSTLTLSMFFIDLDVIDNEITWKFNVQKIKTGYRLEMLYDYEQKDKVVFTLKEY